MLRRIAAGLACLLVVVFSAARVSAGEESGPSAKVAKLLKVLSVHQLQPDDQHGVAYSLAATSDGGVQLTGRMSDLVLQKTSYADGHFTLRLTSGNDVVVFSVTAAGTTITRAGRSVVVPSNTATDRDADRARALLAGSSGVRRYRQLAAALEESDDNSPAAHGVLIAAAVVHGLDGDPGAAPRIARRLATRREPARLQRIASGQPSLDCWVEYETRVNTAYTDYQVCLASATWYTYNTIYYACSGVWVIRVEGYWFQYLRCSAFF